MNREILTRIIVVAVIVTLSHSIFWFFKAGQIEKNINNFVGENSANISVGEIEVSGFPFSQKVSIKDLKFTLPNAAIGRYQILVKDLEASAGVFGSDFTVVLKEQVTVQDSESSVSGYVEFASQPEIKFSVVDGALANLSYKDSGHKVLDAEKNVIFATSSVQVNFVSSHNDGKVKNSVNAEVKDIEGFDIVSVYKNSSEKKIIDGIKTGEISIGSSAAIPAQPSDGSAEAVAAPAASLAPAQVVASVVKTDEVKKDIIQPSNNPVAAEDNTKANDTKNLTAENNAPNSVNVDNNQQPVNSEVAADNIIRSNFVMNIEYELTPNSDQGQNVSDPTQMKENTTQYNKAIKINSLEFSNSLYKISINGQVNIFPDDSQPSGSISVKVENLDNLVTYFNNGLAQIAEQKKPELEVQSSDLAIVNQAGNAAVADNNTAYADPYQNFLQKLVASLPAVTKEVAAKNQLSDGVSATFDIRREKNIEFLVNETPVREILGKF